MMIPATIVVTVIATIVSIEFSEPSANSFDTDGFLQSIIITIMLINKKQVAK